MEVVVGDAEASEPDDELLGGFACDGDAGDVALDVSEECGDAGVAHGLGDGLERDGLARAGCTGDETVAVGHFGKEVNRVGCFRDLKLVIYVHPSILSDEF